MFMNFLIILFIFSWGYGKYFINLNFVKYAQGSLWYMIDMIIFEINKKKTCD